MNVLDINGPEDIKDMNIEELKILAKDIRRFLVSSVSKTGGHLSSNLGVVELTIALHYCLNSPYDKIVWDVGHQAYIHKILTGRAGDFASLRQYGGLSGFPKSSESEHDHFDTGHSSTSISVALGFAVARELKKEKNTVVAVIGDGALTGGMAYEALNNAGRLNSNLIVILNDNQMSISKNVGALSKNLSKLRTNVSYLNAKTDLSNFLEGIPVVGKGFGNALHKTKEVVRNAILDGGVFEELGFKYIGILDGHNLEDLISIINKVKNLDSPILIHINTRKGKGYNRAEAAPSEFHGVSAFNVKTGEKFKVQPKDTFTNAFGEHIVELGKKNENIVAISAAMIKGTGLEEFSKTFPRRTFDVGIAEEHAVTFAAALAKEGMVPFFAVYSTFLQRGYDQIIHDVCIQNLKVIFAIDRSGLVGEDGETHQGVFDLSYLLLIPNITILAPKNSNELKQMMDFAVKCEGSVAIRYPKTVSSKLYSQCTLPMENYLSETIFQGEDIVLISVGSVIDRVTYVYDSLVERGYNPTLINVRFIKPIDLNMVESLRTYKYIFVCEDNVTIGGFNSYLLQSMNELNINKKVTSFAIPDAFVPHGSVDELNRANNIDKESMLQRVLDIIGSEEHE